ncbi:hypothetical protein [Rhizobium sp. 2MFCol3.1]|uniref:hypothetical protein n=1 Tax=Rhizobium sp. 2MFCol3.1 TaxID=1246459 RepID=UPI000381703E|nr:hypothetical protein [Rhizobium sp. 2MFCol3.1]
MAKHLNAAAVQSLLELEAPVKAALTKIFEKAERDPALIDLWTQEIIANSYELEGAAGASPPPINSSH